MVKRFIKNEHYTLCLITYDRLTADPHTWTVNVTYNIRLGNVLEFCNSDAHYSVDLDTKLVMRVDNENDNKYSFSTLTNIVKGWQW